MTENRDIPCGATKECGDCGARCEFDIYYTIWGILCGDCRYERRHGRRPVHERRIGGGSPYSSSSSGRYNGSSEVHLIGQFDTVNVRSAQHAAILGEVFRK